MGSILSKTSGRVRHRIIRRLKKGSIPFVILEKDETKVVENLDRGDLVVIGDATSEDNLKKAGVGRALGFVWQTMPQLF